MFLKHKIISFLLRFQKFSHRDHSFINFPWPLQRLPSISKARQKFKWSTLTCSPEPLCSIALSTNTYEIEIPYQNCESLSLAWNCAPHHWSAAYSTDTTSPRKKIRKEPRSRSFTPLKQAARCKLEEYSNYNILRMLHFLLHSHILLSVALQGQHTSQKRHQLLWYFKEQFM